MAETEGFEPSVPFRDHTGFQNPHHKPSSDTSPHNGRGRGDRTPGRVIWNHVLYLAELYPCISLLVFIRFRSQNLLELGCVLYQEPDALVGVDGV